MMDFYVVEYSYSQGALHIQKFEEALVTNKMLIMSGFSQDYVPIGYAVDYKEALEVGLKFRESLASKQVSK